MRWFLAATLLLCPTLAAAATLQVTPSGSDRANCVDAPCKTIQHAADLAEPGDTVLIQDGVYAGFAVPRSGLANLPIAFAAEHRCKAQVLGTVALHGQSHLTVRGLNIRAAHGNVAGVGIELRGVATDIHIDRNCVYSTSDSCIAAWGTPWKSDPKAQNYQGLTDIRITDNTLLKCNNGGWNEGITIANGVDGVLIEGNEVGDTPSDRASGANGGEGIDLKAGVSNARVLNNWVHDRPHLCIYADGGGAGGFYASAPLSRNIEIAFNRVTRCGDTAIQVSTEASGHIDGVSIHDNTIAGTSHGFGILVYRHPSAADWAKPLAAGCVKNVSIKNNRIEGAAAGPTQLDSACSSGVTFTNNGPAVVTGALEPAPPAPNLDTAALKSDLAAMESDAAAIKQHLSTLETTIARAKGKLQ